MQQLAAAAQVEAQGVEAGVAQAVAVGRLEKGGERCRAHQEQRTEVEVVAQGAHLVVDDGVQALLVAAVAIHEQRARSLGGLHHALQAAVAGLQGVRAEVERGVGGTDLLRNGAQKLRARDFVSNERGAMLVGIGRRGVGIGRGYIYMVYRSRSLELLKKCAERAVVGVERDH